MNIVLLGPPGSGKGTQAEKLSDKLNLLYLQTGDLAREWAEKNKRIKSIIESGKLIPEKEMTAFVMQYLEETVPPERDILFEGFPRFVSQFKSYQEWLTKRGKKIDAVIFLDSSEGAIIKRLSARRICDKCGEVYNLVTNPPKNKRVCDKCGGRLISRKDDNPDSIRIRFKYYHGNTQKLIEYLDRKGLVIKVNADRPIEVIFKDILKKLGVKSDRN